MIRTFADGDVPVTTSEVAAATCVRAARAQSIALGGRDRSFEIRDLQVALERVLSNS